MSIIGLAFAGNGAVRLIDERLATGALLMVIGGLVLLGSTGYAVVRDLDPEVRDRPTLVGATLSLVGSLLVFV